LTEQGEIKEEQKMNLLLLNYIFLAPVSEEAATTNTVIKITHKNSRTNITCTKGRHYTVLQNQYASKNVKNVF